MLTPATQKRIWDLHVHILETKKMHAPGSWDDMVFLALGASGEGGEVANEVKKIWRESKNADRNVNLGEEIADTIIYLKLLADVIHVNVDEAVNAKVDKLKLTKYPEFAG